MMTMYISRGNTNLVVRGLDDVGAQLPIGDIKRAKDPAHTTL